MSIITKISSSIFVSITVSVFVTLSLATSCLVVIFVAASSSSSAEFQPTIAFVHRHGARTPQGVIDQIATCKAPLCQLTDAGIAMTNSVGKHLLNNFFKPLVKVDKYDVKKIQSISTDTKRTVQSAESVLAGAFGEEVAPFVDFIPTTIDYNMSFWNSWPYYFISNARKERLDGYPSQFISQKFSQALLNQFGVVLGAQKICSTSPVDCLILAADVLECNSSNGAPVAQVLKDNEALIHESKIVMFSKLMGYDPNLDHCTQPGSWGFDFALQMANHLNYSRGPSGGGGTNNNSLGDDVWPLQVFHFSAHDWTLFPLYSAFGFWLPEFTLDTKWIPHFADTLLLHTVAPQNPADSYTNPGVKAFRFFPRQVRNNSDAPVDMPSTFPVENQEEIGLRCSDEAGIFLGFSNETQYGCTLQQVINTIQRVAPQASPPDGKCYVTKKILNTSGCLSDEAPQSDSGCHKFRSVCSHMPCGSYLHDSEDPPKRCPVTGRFFKIADPARDFACTDVRPGWNIGENSDYDSATGDLQPKEEVEGDTEYPAATAAPLVVFGVLVGIGIGFVLVRMNYGKVANQLSAEE